MSSSGSATKATTTAKDSIDYWRYINPYHRFVDLSLGDGGSMDQLIRNKETADLSKLVQPKHPSTPQPVTANTPKPTVSIPPVLETQNAPQPQPPLATVSPIRGGSTDLDLTVHMNNGRNESADFAGLELDDVGDDDWGFFQTNPAVVAAAPTTTIPPTTTTTTGVMLNEASPAVSLPACSPPSVAVPYTPGVTTSLSPIPITLNFASASTASGGGGATGVQPTPDPTTPGVLLASEEYDHHLRTVESRMDSVHESVVGEGMIIPMTQQQQQQQPQQQEDDNEREFVKVAFNVESIIRREKFLEEEEGEGQVLPIAWKSVDLDFELVWSRTRRRRTKGRRKGRRKGNGGVVVGGDGRRVWSRISLPLAAEAGNAEHMQEQRQRKRMSGPVDGDGDLDMIGDGDSCSWYSACDNDEDDEDEEVVVDVAPRLSVLKYGAGGKYVYRSRAAACAGSSPGVGKKRGISSLSFGERTGSGRSGKYMRMNDDDDSGSESGSSSSSSSSTSSSESESGDEARNPSAAAASGGSGGASGDVKVVADDLMEEDEVLEDGEVGHPVPGLELPPHPQPRVNSSLVGTPNAINSPASTTAAMTRISSERIVAKNEAEATMALQILADSMTIGRGYMWSRAPMCYSSSLEEACGKSLRPLFENRMLHFLGSVVSDLFGGGASAVGGSSAGGSGDSSSGVRGPLSIEQMFDFSELDRGTSKYGKFQLKKKKRPDPTLDHLRMPSIVANHNNIPISVNPASLRFWEKLALAPVCGPKNVEYVVMCPGGNKGLIWNLRRWCMELSNIWDFCNFGVFGPLMEYRNAEEEGFCPVRVTRPSQTDSRDDVRIRSYAAAVDHLATDLSKILSHRISKSKTSTTNIVIILLNPFPHRKETNSELHILASHLLFTIARFSELPLSLVMQTIVPVVVPIHFAMPRLNDAVGLVDLKEFLFGLFSRCKHTNVPSLSDATVATAEATPTVSGFLVKQFLKLESNTPAITISSLSSTHCHGFSLHPYILGKSNSSSIGGGGGGGGGGGAAAGLLLHRSLESPQITCLSDPDRIMHIVYRISKCRKRVGVCWSDSLGELVDSCVLSGAVSNDDDDSCGIPNDVWERTLLLLGLTGGGGGFKKFISWRFVVGVVVDGTVGGDSGVSLEELQVFEKFMDYISTSENVEHQHPSISSISFVSLNSRPPLAIVDPGAVVGQSGGGTSQYFLSSGETLGNEKKGDAVAFAGRGGIAMTSDERLVPDGTATYLFLSKNHRLPIGSTVQVSINSFPESRIGSDVGGGHSPGISVAPEYGIEACGAGGILPLAGGYIINVPRREAVPPIPYNLSEPPSSAKVGQQQQQSQQGQNASAPTKAPVYPPDGSKSVSIMEVSLLLHTTIKSNPSPTLPASASLQQQQQQGQTLPTTPQPSTPYTGSVVGGLTTASLVPQVFHTNILRDVLREYDNLRHAHLGPGAELSGSLQPWMSVMASVCSELTLL
ncbi:UNVERIFIED_CONTAM: Mediator of RNA polymerase II transcription subunit 13-like [Siphonaria sp. JEL0065]|nr:Mediator of RNA polymerase II transcription subunit 13-like [Siphonaria sp. JEL0065]